MEKQKVTECTHGSMVIDIKDNLNNVSSMERGYKNLQMEIFTRDTTKMGNLKAKVNTFGVIKAHTRENLSKD